MATANQRVFIESLPDFAQQEVVLRGWVCRMRVLGKTTFVVLKNCSGEVQCVAAPESIKEHHLKLEDAIEIVGRVRHEARAKSGYELDIVQVRVLLRENFVRERVCTDWMASDIKLLDSSVGRNIGGRVRGTRRGKRNCGPLVTNLLFLEASDFDEAVKIAKTHPGTRYGGNIEVRAWALPGAPAK
jgi:hypothetical protein